MEINRANIQGKLHYILILLMVFILPLSEKTIPILIAALVINWIVEGKFVEKFKNIKNNHLVILFVSLYLIHLMGLIYSKNISFGLFDLEVKLSLLIFPLILFSCGPITSKMTLNVFLSFYYGALTAIFICLTNALLIYLHTGHVAFFYMKLSIFLHPTYFAMYLNLAIASMIYFILEKPSLLNKFLRNIFYFMIFFFTFFIILLSSKAGIICSVFVFVISLLYYQIKYKKTRWLLFSVTAIAILYFITFKFIVINDYQRIVHAEKILSENKYTERSTPESNRVRLYIWQISRDIIKDNFWLGVGTGDIHDVLNEKYRESGMVAAENKNLNAHNQYIQTFLSLGLFGFVLLFSGMLVPFLRSTKRKNYLYVMFIFIVGFNCLFESIIEVQAGVVFYAFFNSFLLHNDTW